MFKVLMGLGSEPTEVDDSFATQTRFDGLHHAVTMAGELDLVSRRSAFDACTASTHRNVVVDLSGVTFMDCAGYGALAAARSVLEDRGGTLVLSDSVGQPFRLLMLVGQETLPHERTAGVVTEQPNGEDGALPPETTVVAPRQTPRNRQRDEIDQWGAAFARGDIDEVDRLMHQHRLDRIELATSGRIGPMLGQTEPPAETMGFE